MGAETERFLNFASEAGLTYWQAAFADNPYQIDFVSLVEFEFVKSSELTPWVKLTVCGMDFGAV